MSFKFTIKARVTGAALFTAELDATLESASDSVKLGASVKEAVKAKANLRGAYLGGADLGGADLGGAYLGGADLRGADLGGADLGGADLRGADLRGADLGGADLGEGLKASCSRPVIQLGPVGKYCEYIFAFITVSGPHIRTFDFTGPLAEFRTRVRATTGDDANTLVWLAALQLIEAHCLAYPPAEESAT